MIARLIPAVLRLLQAGVADFFAAQHGTAELRIPHVWRGGVPPEFQDEEAYPCLIVRWHSGELSEDEDVAEVDIFVGVYGKDGPGAADEWAAAACTRLAVLLRATQVLEDTFERLYPVKIQKRQARLEEDHHADRYLVAVVTTRWRMPAPAQPVEEV